MQVSAEELRRAYTDWTRTSAKLTEEARRYLPGGDTRSSAYYPPYPAFMSRGEGCRLWDVDGHEYVDFMNNFTSLIHGHAHPPTVAAVTEQIARGSAYAAPSESQLALARLLCERVPSIDELRFCSSGTEATAMCIRAARACTGKQKVMKVEGGYHGSHELGEMSLVPLPGKAGPPEDPVTLAPDRSINGSEILDIITIPFNDADAARARLEEHGNEVAALIVEPMLGGMGMVPPQPGYLAELRRFTEECEVLLVFDEVITLRLSTGGLQARSGVTPDLTAMGKIIGGGLPIGAFGGRREILEIFNPDRLDAIMHASTFSGNALTMAAGLAALEDLSPDELDRINRLGDRLRAGFNAVFKSAGIRGQATGIGSLSHLHLWDGPMRNARDSVRGFMEGGRLPNLLHLGMMRRGIYPAGRQMYCISTPMGEEHVDRAVSALEETLAEVRPLIEQEFPNLVRQTPMERCRVRKPHRPGRGGSEGLLDGCIGTRVRCGLGRDGGARKGVMRE
jgi:glutamate-1-semialdehyde 2,1-aminomutase